MRSRSWTLGCGDATTHRRQGDLGRNLRVKRKILARFRHPITGQPCPSGIDQLFDIMMRLGLLRIARLQRFLPLRNRSILVIGQTLILRIHFQLAFRITASKEFVSLLIVHLIYLFFQILVDAEVERHAAFLSCISGFGLSDGVLVLPLDPVALLGLDQIFDGLLRKATYARCDSGPLVE